MSGNQQQVADLIAGHRTVVRKRLLIIAVLIVAAVLSFLVAAAVGAITIPLGDVLMGLIRPSTLDAETRVVLWDLRLPMAVMAVLILSLIHI